MANFDPTLTQRLVTKAKARIVPDWRSRWGDLSTRIAKWGALLQAGLLMVPAEDLALLPKNLSAYFALAMFVLIGAAKLITEPARNKDQP